MERTNAKKKDSKKKQHGERTASTWIIFVMMVIFLVFMWMPFQPARAVYTAILGLVAAMACREILHAVGCGNKILYAITMCVSAFVPFVFSYHLQFSVGIAIIFYVLLLLLLMVVMNASVKFTDVLAGLYASLWIPFGFSCFVFLRDVYLLYAGQFLKWEGFFLVMCAFGCSWGPDGLAYLVGRKFGKHKLSPVISPKKSVEGAVGGVLLTGIGLCLVLLIYSAVIKAIYGDTLFTTLGGWKYPVCALTGIVLAIVSIFGDLAASVIKRNFGIKDYSSLFPGHGGIMDRFDSSLFVLPVLYGSIYMIMK